MKIAATLCTLAAVLAASSARADEPKTMMMVGEVTPPAGPRVTDWSDFYITGEFLWWNPKQEGLSYVSGGRNTGSLTDFKGHKEYVSSHYRAGFKVGFGFDFRHDGWDLYANYTWLSPAALSGRTSATARSGGLVSQWLFPLPLVPASPVPALAAQARWKLRFNVLDTELGRNFYLSSKLTMRPYMGFKAAWIAQDYDASYEVDQALADFAAISKVSMDNDQDFTGFGLRGGLNSSWKIGQMWYLYGNLAFSALWSEFENHRKDHLITATGSTFHSNDVEDTLRTVSPVLEMGLGLQYIQDFKNGRWRFTFQIGWEEQVWLYQNKFIDSFVENNGALTLQGLTGKIAFAW